MGKTIGTGIVAVFGVMLGGIVLLAAPEAISAAFVVAAVCLAAATAATVLSVRRTLGWNRREAGVWLEGAAIPVGVLWMLGAFVQGLTSTWWSWKVATALELVAACAWAVVTMAAAAAAAAALQEDTERAASEERHERLLAAARDVMAMDERTGVRAELAARVLNSRPGELGDALAEEEMEGALRAGGRRGR